MSQAQPPLHPARSALIGRQRELKVLRDCLTGAAQGQPQVVLLEGATGVGKTSLLVAGLRLAREQGFRIGRGTASSLGSGVSFGVVQQVFEALLAQLPADQVAGLSEPERYGYDLVRAGSAVREPDAEIDMYRALWGLYRLGVHLARSGPLCFVVDDLQWVDVPSLHWLVSSSRRMERLPVLLLVAQSTGVTPADPLLVSELRQSATVVKVDGLGLDGVAELISTTLGRPPAPEFTAACRDATGGNPFILRYLLAALQERSVTPDAAAAAQVTRYKPDELGEAVLARLNRRSPHLVALARAVAVLDRPSTALAAATAELPVPVAADAARQLADAGLLIVEDDRVRYAQAIMQSAVERSLSHTQRDALHARAATHLHEVRARATAVAAHLVRTTARCGAWAVDVLRAAAGTALADGDPACSAKFLARALREAPAPPVRHQLLIRLGLAESHYDPHLAAQHLGEVVDLVDDPPELAKVAVRLAQALYLDDQYDEAGQVCVRAIRRIGARDPDATNFLELTLRLIAPSSATGELDWGHLSPAWRRKDSYGRRVASLIAENESFEGTSLDLTRDAARAALAHGVGQILHEPLQVLSAVNALVRTDDLDLALYHCDRAVAEAHVQGLGLPGVAVRTLRARVRHQRGELPEAAEDARRALAAMATAGVRSHRHFAFVFATDALVRALVDLDELAAAQEALADVGLSTELPMSWHHTSFLYCRGKLRLALGDPRGALTDQLLCGERLGRWHAHNPAVRPWRAGAARAHLQLGNKDEAMRLALDDLTLARKWKAAVTVGRALHTVGHVAGGAEAVTWLSDAASTLAGTGARQLQAACLLDLGAARWEQGQLEAARADLRLARELAGQCSAKALLRRLDGLPAEAVGHGDAAGDDLDPALPGMSALTPHERRVAGLVLNGATNGDIAQRLSVSRRTVEFHLTSIYRKLGVQRRAQLLAVLMGRPAPEKGTP